MTRVVARGKNFQGRCVLFLTCNGNVVAEIWRISNIYSNLRMSYKDQDRELRTDLGYIKVEPRMDRSEAESSLEALFKEFPVSKGDLEWLMYPHEANYVRAALPDKYVQQ